MKLRPARKATSRRRYTEATCRGARDLVGPNRTMPSLDSQYSKDRRQQAIVDHQSGTLVALAGPGTGKTHSLVLRICELTENRGIDSSHLCYLTFIRDIARAFKDDLCRKHPGKTMPQHITACTLHSLACRLIRNRGHKVQLKGHLCILNLCDKHDPLAEIAVSDIQSLLPKDSGIKSPAMMRLYLLSLKSRRQKGQSTTNLTSHEALVEGAYQAYSRALRLLDWDEVVPLASALYASEDDRPSWIDQYQHLLIDEYQDFNVAEQLFVELFSRSAVSCVIVGDDDQSIYRERGASPNGIRQLVQDPNAHSISLVLCRARPPEQISLRANAFLSFMHTNPRLLEAVKPGGTVAIRSYRSAKAEADGLVEYLRGILSQVDETAPPDEGVVCLFPQNKVLAQYRTEFEARGLRCKCRDPSNLLDEKMWVRTLGRLAFQRSQPFLERVVLERFCDIKPRHRRDVLATLLGKDASLSSSLDSCERNQGWRQPALSAASEYRSFIQSVTGRDATQIASCIDSVLSGRRQCDPGYVDHFLDLATADETMLEEYLDELVDGIYQNSDQESGGVEPEPAVELLTIHSSKGLTRRHVILPGLEHYWIPNDATGDLLEERKRLFFVGITRAAESLLITYPRSRARGDSLNLRKPGCLELSEFARVLGVTEERL